MNNDELLRNINDLFKTSKAVGSASDSYKKEFEESDSLSDSSNMDLIERNNPKNIFEIKDTLEKLKELESKGNSKDFSFKDKINELKSFLGAGIVLGEIPYHSEFIEVIRKFLGSNGFSDNFVLDNLKDMEGHVLPVEYLYGGKAQALRKHIDLDLDFFDYDEEGKVDRVSSDKEELYRHVVVHEFFHKLSSYKNGYKDVMVGGDALLEGFTDLYTNLALGDKVESDLYGFPVKVCDLFTEMIGLDKTLDDYINHTGEFHHLESLFGECGVDHDGFIAFKTTLSSVISGVRRDKKDGLPKEEWGIDEKASTLDFLRDNIVIPYCQNNPDKADGVLSKFNNLFSNMGYTCSMEDIKTSKK